MAAAQTIDEATTLAIAWAEETRHSARASATEARRAWDDARPVDVTEEAWAARWDDFASDAIRAAADALASHTSAELSLEEIESSVDGDDDDGGSDDADSTDDDEDYGWDGSPVRSIEDWEAWGDLASDFQQVASDWEDVELLWTALTARVHAGQLDAGEAGTA